MVFIATLLFFIFAYYEIYHQFGLESLFSSLSSIFKKLWDDVLIFTGTAIATTERNLETRFKNKHVLFYSIITIVTIATWLIFFMIGDKPQKIKEEKRSEQIKQITPSLFPLADYYLFENNINIDETDLIVKPKFKLKENTIKERLHKDSKEMHRLFIKENKIIKKEMAKLNF